MKKNYLILLFIFISLLGLEATNVLAFGGIGWRVFGNISSDQIAQKQQLMFEQQARILGIDIEKIKNYWAEGKTLKEIMETEGINQEQIQARIKDFQLEKIKSYLDALVSRGVISREQANKRLETMRVRDNGRQGKGLGLKMFGFRSFRW